MSQISASGQLVNVPQYKVYGTERRKLRKEIAELRQTVKMFWFYDDIDIDRAYGLHRDKELCNIRLHELQLEIVELEKKLNEPYL
jgi:hypothetical protein